MDSPPSRGSSSRELGELQPPQAAVGTPQRWAESHPPPSPCSAPAGYEAPNARVRCDSDPGAVRCGPLAARFTLCCVVASVAGATAALAFAITLGQDEPREPPAPEPPPVSVTVSFVVAGGRVPSGFAAAVGTWLGGLLRGGERVVGVRNATWGALAALLAPHHAGALAERLHEAARDPSGIAGATVTLVVVAAAVQVSAAPTPQPPPAPAPPQGGGPDEAPAEDGADAPQCAWRRLPAAFLRGYATGDAAAYSFERAQAVCIGYGAACGGITCDKSWSCSPREASRPSPSGAGETSWAKDCPATPIGGAACVGFRREWGCGAGAWREPSGDLGCEVPLPDGAAGWCQCAGAERVRVGCGADIPLAAAGAGRPLRCSTLCALPPRDECRNSTAARCPPRELCVDTDTSLQSTGDWACACPGDWRSASVGRSADCAERYSMLPAARGNCSAGGMLSISSEAECASAARLVYRLTRTPSAAVAAGGEPAEVRCFWSTAAGGLAIKPKAGTGDAEVCSRGAQSGGLRLPARDWLLPVAEQLGAVRALLRRVLGSAAAEHFSLRIGPALPGLGDAVQGACAGGGVHLNGTSPVALARGVHHYLTHFARISVDRAGRALGPAPLPGCAPFSLQSLVPLRYHFNVVTFGYSTAWWRWPRWEEAIDRMALHGINMPLAQVGQERIWRDVFVELGVRQRELDAFWGGAVFLPWQRMGNVDGWGGPLPARWIEERHELQLRILARMRSLGMLAVLPAFAGHVPHGLAALYPEARIRNQSSWNGFAPTALLDPADPLFVRVASAAVRLQRKLYGWASHFYSADTFNEMPPEDGRVAYLQAAAAGVLGGMQAGDPFAKWVMQSWMMTRPGFWQAEGRVDAYLSGAAREHLLVLDLAAEALPLSRATAGFSGRSWVWCLLHNYGGRPGVYGDVATLADDPRAALAAPGSGMVGIGASMEATGHNPAVYEFLSDVVWEGNATADLDLWADTWATARYGGTGGAEAQQAWRKILQVFYLGRSGASGDPTDWAMYRSPAVGSRCVCSDCAPYQMQEGAAEALQLLLGAREAHPDLESVGEFRYDLAEVAAAVAQGAACAALDGAAADSAAYNEAVRRLAVELALDAAAAAAAAAAASAAASAAYSLLQRLSLVERALGEIDSVLLSGVGPELGCWLEEATAWGGDAAERARLHRDARNILTLWGPVEDTSLMDYARRAWAGMVSGYHLRRWQLFREGLAEAVGRGAELPDGWAPDSVGQFERWWGLQAPREEWEAAQRAAGGAGAAGCASRPDPAPLTPAARRIARMYGARRG